MNLSSIPTALSQIWAHLREERSTSLILQFNIILSMMFMTPLVCAIGYLRDLPDPQ